MDERRLVTIKTFNYERDAEAAKQHLQTHGIDAMISKDDCGGMRPWLQQRQGVFLQVFDCDSGNANKILHAMKS
jgi:hypothetical protein